MISYLGMILVFLVWSLFLIRKFFGKSITKRPSKDIIIFSGISLMAFLIERGYWTYGLFRSWQKDPLMSYLLPPKHSWDYFLTYAFSRYFAPLFVTFLVAIILSWLVSGLNRKFDERFMEEEEPYLFGLGILLSGYPGFFLYIPLMLLCGIFMTAIYLVLQKGRAPLYEFWLPVVLLAILIMKFMVPALWISKFNF